MQELEQGPDRPGKGSAVDVVDEDASVRNAISRLLSFSGLARQQEVRLAGVPLLIAIEEALEVHAELKHPQAAAERAEQRIGLPKALGQARAREGARHLTA